MEELTFAPDRRSVQTTFYHFSNRPSGFSDQKVYSHHDSLRWALEKIYENKFAGLSPVYRKILVDILTTEVPLDHRNLTLLAVANYIVYSLKLAHTELTPPLFSEYFRHFEPFLMPDVGKKNPVEIEQIRVNFKTTLLRYIIYVQNNTSK